MTMHSDGPAGWALLALLAALAVWLWSAVLDSWRLLALAIVDDGIGAHDGQGRSEAQGRGRYAVDATLVERIDGDVGSEPRTPQNLIVIDILTSECFFLKM